MIYLPLVIQRGEKPEEAGMPKRTQVSRWPWTNPTQEVLLSKPLDSVLSVEIDPSLRLADINRENNKFEQVAIQSKK
jgi:hypothetical protein